MTLPDPLLAARLDLRVRGTDASAATALVGDVIDVDVWVDSESATLSGAAVFLSFDGDVFELLDQDQDPVTNGFQPFAPGGFFSDGEIFRNELLSPDDPAATPAGEQLDYSVVRASDVGSGPAASFRLRALAPAAGSTIRIDESGIRETRYFKPDGTHESFRFITPLNVDVRGITIQGLPEQIVLSRGQVDSTSFVLDRMLFDPVYSPQDIDWHVDATEALDVRLDLETRRLILTAPTDRSLWEQLTLRAVNPDGQTTSATFDLFVNTGPVLTPLSGVIEIAEDEDHRISLDELAEDLDSPDAQLLWTLSAPPELGARLEGPPHELILEPWSNWNGSGQITVWATDRFGFVDSTSMDVRVAAINDDPRSLYAPNLRITKGKADSSLALVDLFADADDELEALNMVWSGADQIGLARRDGRLVVTAPENWEGTEKIQIAVTDAQGATVTAPLTVTVVASLAPAITGAPQRLGVVAGGSSILDLKDFIADPDDLTSDLTWSVTGNVELLVQISTSGAVRIDAPSGFAGTEMVRISAFDPSGESTFFDLLLFGAPSDGAPLLAPLPTVSLPPGGVDTSIDLNDYVFDLNHEPREINWSVSGPVGLELRVDGSSHVLTVIAADSLLGDFDVDLRATDPEGLEATSRLRVRITATPVDPVDPTNPVDPVAISVSLAPLPTLHMTSGGFDQSLVLDGYIESGDPASVTWEAVSAEHVQVLVDNATRRVTVLAEDGWTGPALIAIRALDGAGNIVAESFMGIQVDAALAGLVLRDLLEIPVLQGDSLLSFDPAAFLVNGPDPASLAWAASGSRPYEVSMNEGLITLHAGGFDNIGGEAVTIIARDEAGNQASATLLVQVLPADGTVGNEREGFRLAIVPNPVHPAFLDLFVLNDDSNRPVLRQRVDEWSSLELSAVTDGIWHAPHALQPGMEGTVSFLALSLEDDGVLTRSQRDIHVGTVPAGAGKRIAGVGFSLDLHAGSFSADGDAVVAVIPEPGKGPSASSELKSVGSTYRVHATGTLQRTSQLTLRSNDPKALAYRWQASSKRWHFVEANVSGEEVTIEVDKLGRYALLTDDTKPSVADLEDGRFHVTDGGSGIRSVTVHVQGVQLADAVVAVAEMTAGEGTFQLTDIVADASVLELRAVDRAGNVTSLRVETTSVHLLPNEFKLGQNFPNPFNPETTIPIRMGASGGTVQLQIFNTAGQQIRTLIDDILPAGERSVAWDGQDAAGMPVASGSYIYRAVTRQGVFAQRMTLLR
jgi:hypothetical protein